MDDLISRQAAIDAIGKKSDEIYKTKQKGATYPHDDFFQGMAYAGNVVEQMPSAQPDTEKICARIKAEAIKRNVEYMKHGDRYMLGFVDGMRLARRIVDGTIDDPVYFTLSGE